MNLRNNLLPILIFASLILGIAVTRLISFFPGTGTDTFIEICGWMGTAFLNLLKMVVAPLVFSSIVTGVAGIGSASSLGRIAGKTLGLFLVTTVIAIILGLALVNIVRPGSGVDLKIVGGENQGIVSELVEKTPTVGSVLMDAIPANVFRSFADGDMLPIIVFAILFGMFATKIKPEHGQKLLGLFNAVYEVMIKMTRAIISLTPLGVFGITVAQFSQHGDMASLLSSLGLFIAVVLAGILIHFFVIIPVFLKIGGVAPYRHMKNMALPLVTAFTTASSSATLPLTMEAVEEKSGVSNRIASFVLPLGATINMNGTALFECVSVIFLAQAYGIDLTFAQQVIVVVTSLLAAVGAAGIPMAGFVMMTVILTAVGLPLEGIGIIMSVNVILDMSRTATNVWGDCAVAAIVAKSEGETLNV